MLNPLWLHTFKTLIETGHFTQTAEKLHMTQPGVSQQVKKLEQACGHTLLRREKKSFELTEQGRRVYQYALKLAQDEAALLEHLSFDNPYSGICRLSCSGSLSLLLYPQLLCLQNQHPELVIHLEAAPNYKILDDIQNATIDLGIVTHIPSASLFHSEVIGTEPLCLILPQQYQDRPITPDLLKRCGVVKHPDAEHYLSLYFDQSGEPELAKLNIEELPTAGYVNQLSQILLPVAQGIGFTVLPYSALESFPQKELLYVPTAKQTVAESLHLVTKRNRPLPKRYQTIRQLFLEALRTNLTE
ncbi:LysR family transcriptional regulator [Photobacterium sp. SDRW27]|uniref:LysR family transcriptional regulator n=1 Tax=Photobacterium obscurum TaxID=2829490 RepID=UPI0022443112|nr:LysR family transcriptional regulator [Photobacterium obscurum]MCW8328881.1 LysR family transcriptional regulator [Photobacterium obscurum]